MKNYKYVSLLVILATILAAGCSSSSNDKTESQSIYQDAAWKESVQKNAALLSTDFKNVQIAISAITSSNNPDFTTLATVGQNLIDDSQKALNENNQTTLSPKYQDAQKEWVMSLQDANSAGQYVLKVANDGKNKDITAMKSDADNVSTYSTSATTHVTRANTLMQNADK